MASIPIWGTPLSIGGPINNRGTHLKSTGEPPDVLTPRNPLVAVLCIIVSNELLARF